MIFCFSRFYVVFGYGFLTTCVNCLVAIDTYESYLPTFTSMYVTAPSPSEKLLMDWIISRDESGISEIHTLFLLNPSSER